MKKMFMAVIALMMTISASAQFYIYFSDGTVTKVDSISMIAPGEPEKPDTPTEPEEPTNPSAGIGVFSVGEGKTVTFSKGNLQYHPANNDWRFAESQLDYIGAANSNCSSSYNGWLDLFGWSTSANNFGVSTSQDDADYSGSFLDWGTNQISADAPNTWRTLSYDEWNYLLDARPNASSLRGVAQVNGVNGLIFLPDTWVCPEGITFKSGFHISYGVDYYADYQTFTAEQWSKLESAGAVFLPALGRRDSSNVSNVQYYGGYWSATEYYNRGAYFLSFGSGGAGKGSGARCIGHSVRLVKDIEGGGTTPDTPTNTENGYEYVDLGLSVKWATCNVGASKPEEYGDYFAWGETQPKDTYNWSTYKWCEGTSTTLTKYNNNSTKGAVDSIFILEATDDAAAENWGGNWRMPTDAEWTELCEQCTWTWTTQNGVYGYKVTSKSKGNSIFLPAAGFRNGSVRINAGSNGRYWSSSLYTGYPCDYAWFVGFGSSGVDWFYGWRCHGFTVRPVCP